ncbi:MAG TPA: phage holin family protein [Terracidiphilus sp.]|nr:phage holin family protein [Terracidiphilus sp.]
MASGPTFQSEFQQLGHDIKSYFETRFEILRTELNNTVAKLRSSAMLIGGAAIIAIPSLILLGACVSLAIAYGLGAIPDQAGLIGGFLITGACGLVVAGIAGWAGVLKLKAGNLTPKHTLHVLRRDGESFRNGGTNCVDESQTQTRRRA